MLALRAGRFADAKACAEKGLEKDEGNGLCLLQLAIALERLGLPDRAEETFREAIASDYKPVWVRTEYADFLRRQGKDQAADEEIQRIERAWPDELAEREGCDVMPSDEDEC